MTVTIDHEVERERILAAVLDPRWREEHEDHFDPDTAVVWDLDSTVCHTLHRQHMIPKIRAWSEAVKKHGPLPDDRESLVLPGQIVVPKVTWDDYSLACIRDTPVVAAVSLMKLLWRSHLQLAVSGRGAVAYSETWRWVRAWKVPLDQIILRPEGDYTPTEEFKVREVRKVQDSGITVVLYVDDWPSSAEAVTRELGIPSLTVNPNYECITCGSAERSCPCGAATIGGRGS